MLFVFCLYIFIIICKLNVQIPWPTRSAYLISKTIKSSTASAADHGIFPIVSAFWCFPGLKNNKPSISFCKMSLNHAYTPCRGSALKSSLPPFSPSWATTSFNFNKSHGHFKCPKIIYHTAALQIFGEACLNKNKTFIQYHPVSNQYHYRGFEPTISHHRQPGGSILQATRLHSARPSEYPREQVLSGLAFMRIKNQITCGLRDSP